MSLTSPPFFAGEHDGNKQGGASPRRAGPKPHRGSNGVERAICFRTARLSVPTTVYGSSSLFCILFFVPPSPAPGGGVLAIFFRLFSSCITFIDRANGGVAYPNRVRKPAVAPPPTSDRATTRPSPTTHSRAPHICFVWLASS